MFSSNNHNNNGVYPVAFLFSPFSSHGNDNLATTSLQHHHQHQNQTPYDPFMAAHHHQLGSSTIDPNQIVPVDSMMNYKTSFLSNNVVMNAAADGHNNFLKDCSEVEVTRGKKPLKKDRHSKIHTAQGLRDRRVRLSIGIAREFFDLQDMLGFDKASKTLEWLLKKSRKSIKELVQAKKHNNGYYNITDNEDKDHHTNGDNDNDDDDDDEDENEEDVDGENDYEKKFISGLNTEYCEDLGCDTDKLVMDSFLHKGRRMKNDLNNISKGSKVKAKEKTKEKVRDIDPSQVLNSLSSISQNDVEKSLSTSVHGQIMTPYFYKQVLEDPNKFLVERLATQESIFVKNNQPNGEDMMKHPSSSGNCNTNLPQNWDIYYHNLLGDSPFYLSQR